MPSKIHISKMCVLDEDASHTSNSLTNNEGILYEDAPIGTYYIVVDGQYADSEGDYRLEVSCAYLDCTNAVSLDCGVPYSGNNINGNDNVSLYHCGNVLNVERLLDLFCSQYSHVRS